MNHDVDRDEFPGVMPAAAVLNDGSLLVAFSAKDTAGTAPGDVRIARLTRQELQRVTLANGEEEMTLNASGHDAYAGTVARISYQSGSLNAVAALAWVEDGATKLRYVEPSGATVGPDDFPIGLDSTTLAIFLQITWSDVRKQLFATFADGKNVYSRWVAQPGPGTPALLAQEASVRWVAHALAPDGRGVVAWVTGSSIGDLAKGKTLIRALLLDAEGQPRASAFEVELPNRFENEPRILSLSATNDRYLVVASGSQQPDGPSQLFVVELDAGTGAVTRTARRVFPASDQRQIGPSIARTGDGGFIVAWHDAGAGGTLGALFRPNAEPRFNALTCDESPFSIGARGAGSPTVAVDGDRLVVVHAGNVSTDSSGSATLAWQASFSDLFPAKR